MIILSTPYSGYPITPFLFFPPPSLFFFMHHLIDAASSYWRWIELFSTVRGLSIPFFCRGFLLSLGLDIEFSCLFLRSETCFHSSSICLFRGRVIRICSLLVEVLFILFSSCVWVPDGLAALNYLDCAIGSLHRRSCFGPYDKFKWNQGESLWLFCRGEGSHG